MKNGIGVYSVTWAATLDEQEEWIVRDIDSGPVGTFETVGAAKRWCEVAASLEN